MKTLIAALALATSGAALAQVEPAQTLPPPAPEAPAAPGQYPSTTPGTDLMQPPLDTQRPVDPVDPAPAPLPAPDGQEPADDATTAPDPVDPTVPGDATEPPQA